MTGVLLGLMVTLLLSMSGLSEYSSFSSSLHAEGCNPTTTPLDIFRKAESAMHEIVQSKADLDLPCVTLCYAQTLDGSIAPAAKRRLDISSEASFALLHSLRALHDAVLVGVGTLLTDCPQLTVR
eukprot:gene8282-10213_t